MNEAVDAVATGAVTIASRDVQLNGVVGAQRQVARARGRRAGRGRRDASTRSCARSLERLLAEPRGILTLLTGEDPPSLEALLAELEAEHPELELDVHEGGQPHYPLLLAARVDGRVPRPIRCARRGQRHLSRDARAALRAARRDRGRRERERRATRRRRSCAELQPDVVLMDYRMPGLNGAEATRAVLAACPGTTRRLPDRVGDGAGESHELLAAGAVACVTKDQDFDRHRRRRAGSGRPREPHRREHRSRPRLDGRLPRGAGAVPELPRRAAVRALRRGELPGLRRDRRPSEFYERLQTAPELPTTSQPTPGDFLATYEELAPKYERIIVAAISSTLSGTFGSAETAAEMLGGDKVRVIDSGTVSASIALLALGVQHRLERGTTDEEIDAFVARYQARAPPALHGEHARVPREGRSHRPRGRARREPAEREADPHDPRRRGRSR